MSEQDEMRTHADWAAMKQAREDAAFWAVRALVNGDIEHAQKWTEAFTEAEVELHRIGQELDADH